MYMQPPKILWWTKPKKQWNNIDQWSKQTQESAKNQLEMWILYPAGLELPESFPVLASFVIDVHSSFKGLEEIEVWK
jgi:hypothetical protein